MTVEELAEKWVKTARFNIDIKEAHKHAGKKGYVAGWHACIAAVLRETGRVTSGFKTTEASDAAATLSVAIIDLDVVENIQ